jgi:hypothetical protein
MAWYYSDPADANGKWSLPNINVQSYQGDEEVGGPGYYGCFGFPGCLPDSDLFGPYATEDEAVAALRDMCD